MATPTRDADFVLEHSGFVRTLVRELVFDRELARDVEQETWLVALSNSPGGASPRAWLAALVRNLAFKAWRAKLRRGDRELAVAREMRSVPTPAELLEREDLRREIVEAVVALDEPWRSAMIARYFAEQSPALAAERLGVPLETLRTRLKRGRELLRERLERRHGKSGSSAALLLVRAWRLEPPSYVEAGARALFQGAFAVTLTNKAAIALALIVLFAAAFWSWQRASIAQPSAPSASREVAQLAQPAPETERSVADARERAEVAAPIAHESAATAAAHEPQLASLLLRVVWGEDKAPAADVSMWVYSSTFQSFQRQALELRTAADGTVRVDAFPAGDTLINFDRGQQLIVSLKPGELTERTIEIPAGVDVEGIVRDIDGRPFADAQVWLLWLGDSRYCVARTRSDGTFSIRDVRAELEVSLSAHAPGRAPSLSKRVQAVVGAKATVELAFDLDGGALRGRVVDVRGKPVPHAIVLVGDEARDYEIMASSSGQRPATRRLVAADDGTFECDGLIEGSTPMQAAAPGFARWSGEVEIVAGRTATHEIVLERGARVEGVARDEQGSVLAGIDVVTGRFGFAQARRKTGADGAFVLEGLPLGEFEVTASKDGVGETSATLVGVSGATLRWDPVLKRGHTLRGRIEAAGRELGNWSISARAMDWLRARYSQDVITDAGGRFELTNCPEAPLRIDVRSPTSSFFTVATLENVDPNAGEVVIQVEPSREPSVILRGRVLDAEGRPLASANVDAIASPDGVSVSMQTAADSGRFESELVPAGEWRLQIRADGFAPRNLAAQSITAGTKFDFGDLVLERGGELTIVLRGDVELDPPRSAVSLFAGGTVIAFERPRDGVVRFATIAAGRYDAVLYANGVALRAQTIEAKGFGETRVELAFDAGVAVSIDALDPSGRAIDERVESELRDARERAIDYRSLATDGTPARWTGQLAPGHYRMKLRDLHGRKGELEFDVPESSDEPHQLSVTLR